MDQPIDRRENLDGIKLYLSDGADHTTWVMIRASGTEHMLRIYSETAHAQTTQKVLQHVVSLVQNL
jgi:phosphomannomutase